MFVMGRWKSRRQLGQWLAEESTGKVTFVGYRRKSHAGRIIPFLGYAFVDIFA